MNVLSIFIISFEFVAFIISLIILSILCLQKNKNQKDKDILWIVFLGALLLISDCLAEFYKGNTSEFGYVMTHLCNPLVFMFNYLEMGMLAKYLYDSLTNVLKRKTRHLHMKAMNHDIHSLFCTLYLDISLFLANILLIV